MTLESDAMMERVRLKRRLNFWRVVGVVSVAGALFLALPRGHLSGHLGQHIERYRIVGEIGDGQEQIDELEKLRTDASVAAVLLHLDTPGGNVAGGEGIHDEVARLAASKPVVTVMDGTAASAGYMIAVATPHIVARASTLTGSIGVIMELGDISGLLDKLGIKSDPLVSGPLKGQPSLTAPLSPAGHDYLQALLMDLFDQFVGLVATGRHMDVAKVRGLADGRAYTGRQALAVGLVDELGGEPQALDWLAQAKHVNANLPVDEFVKGTEIDRLLKSSAETLVFSAINALRVDGALALWQPGLPHN